MLHHPPAPALALAPLAELVRDLRELLCLQIVEAMEIMLLAVISPEIRCEWRLEDWQVALVSTVSWGRRL